jgi:hypothetical protein
MDNLRFGAIAVGLFFAVFLGGKWALTVQQAQPGLSETKSGTSLAILTADASIVAASAAAVVAYLTGI